MIVWVATWYIYKMSSYHRCALYFRTMWYLWSRFRVLKTDQGLSMDIVALTSTTPYVAVSHVWSQGLGNSSSNALRMCQLIRLCHYVQALDRMTRPGQQKQPLTLWLDTVCCHVACDVATAAGRKSALKLMHETYARATHVLVLDVELEHVVTTNASVLELAIKFVHSAWTKRLWTFQEGAL